MACQDDDWQDFSLAEKNRRSWSNPTCACHHVTTIGGGGRKKFSRRDTCLAMCFM